MAWNLNGELIESCTCNSHCPCWFGRARADEDGQGLLRCRLAVPRQRRELETIFQGKVGGPMEIMAGLISTWLPTEHCKIDVEDDGTKLTAKVGGVGEIRSEVLKNELGDTMTLQNAGFALAFQFDKAEMKIAPTATEWSDSGLPRSYETHSGARAPWQWAVS